MFQALEKLQGISYHNVVLHTCKYSISIKIIGIFYIVASLKCIFEFSDLLIFTLT